MVNDLIKEEKIQKSLLFVCVCVCVCVWGGGGGGGKLPKFSNKMLTAKLSSRIHIGNEKSLTTMEDQTGKSFCKNSLNAR